LKVPIKYDSDSKREFVHFEDEQIKIINPFDDKDKIIIFDSLNEITIHVQNLISRAEINEIKLNSLVVSSCNYHKDFEEIRKEIKKINQEIQVLTAQMVTEQHIKGFQNKISSYIQETMKQNRTNIILFAFSLMALATSIFAIFSTIIN